jgi:DNA-binding response OmpR family regulator
MATTRVLVVDADPSLCALVDDVLADVGYDVRTSSSFAAALDLVPTWRPHVIVLEPVMHAMDAEAFLAACRKHEVWETPVILLSGTRQLGTEITRLGAQDGLTKPFDIDALCKLVSQSVRPTGCNQATADRTSYAS